MGLYRGSRESHCVAKRRRKQLARDLANRWNPSGRLLNLTWRPFGRAPTMERGDTFRRRPASSSNSSHGGETTSACFEQVRRLGGGRGVASSWKECPVLEMLTSKKRVSANCARRWRAIFELANFGVEGGNCWPARMSSNSLGSSAVQLNKHSPGGSLSVSQRTAAGLMRWKSLLRPLVLPP